MNSLYPGFVKLHYESAYSEHIATIPAYPFNDSGVYKLTVKNNTLVTLAAALAAYVAVIKPLVSSATTFTFGELWVVPYVGDNPVFVLSEALGTAGTNVGAVLPASQVTYSYRTENGGHGKAVILDTGIAVNARYLPPNFGNATIKAVADYLVSSTSMFYARDNSFPISVVKCVTKTNDVLRRKYNLV